MFSIKDCDADKMLPMFSFSYIFVTLYYYSNTGNHLHSFLNI